MWPIKNFKNQTLSYTIFKGINIVEHENYIILLERFSSMSDILFFEKIIISLRYQYN